MHMFLLNMLVSKEFYGHYICLPKNEVPPEILNNPKFFPFFKDCCGAVNGSLLHAFVGKLALACYHCQKGFIATNLFATCLFCLQFCYILAGWEGSAADSLLFDEARRDTFEVEAGTYYLADAGFPLCDALIVLYWRVQYHVKEWEQATLW